jgi:hypothetical protein
VGSSPITHPIKIITGWLDRLAPAWLSSRIFYINSLAGVKYFSLYPPSASLPGSRRPSSSCSEFICHLRAFEGWPWRIVKAIPVQKRFRGDANKGTCIASKITHCVKTHTYATKKLISKFFWTPVVKACCFCC